MYGHVPTAFMKTSIISILKNRNGDSSDKNNYRPIAIVTAMSKLFELCLSKLLDTFLVTSDNQFGFKRKHATDLCIYTVKSVIIYIYLGRFIRKSAKKQLKRNKADKNINTRRLCGENNISILKNIFNMYSKKVA